MKKKNNKNQKKDSRLAVDIVSKLKKVDVGIKDGVFIYTQPLTVEQLSQKTKIHANTIIRHFFAKGISVTINSLLTMEQIGEVCLTNNLDFQIQKDTSNDNFLDHLDLSELMVSSEPRPPIVTIMGHVDHGKTTLLDALRKSHLTKSEKGGITQHLGSYQVNCNGRLITFIDTPGHEAFTEMRARGANITDIVVLVVAADDGVKPQTEEAIDHAMQAKVPIIVFLNKTDKPNINVDLIFNQLSKKNLVPEEWHGDTVIVKGSALKKEGLDQLLESILAIGELNNLRANPKLLPFGVVMDVKITPEFGIQASVIVLQGTLMVGDQILIGSSLNKVRIIIDDNGKFIKSAKPSQPVKIAGLKKIPNVGDRFIGIVNENVGKKIVEQLEQTASSKSNQVKSSKFSANEELKVINLILKIDTRGSLAAIEMLLAKIKKLFAEIEINVIRIAIGAITEGDVRLAQVSNSIIISFNLPISKSIFDLTNSLQVSVRSYDVIYKLQEDLVELVQSYLDPTYDEKICGEASVRKLWFYSKVGTIAGCYVTSGKIGRKMKCKVIRDGKVIHQGTISSLRQKTNDVNEVSTNLECGIVLENFNELQENDIIQTFEFVRTTPVKK